MTVAEALVDSLNSLARPAEDWPAVVRAAHCIASPAEAPALTVEFRDASFVELLPEGRWVAGQYTEVGA